MGNFLAPAASNTTLEIVVRWWGICLVALVVGCSGQSSSSDESSSTGGDSSTSSSSSGSVPPPTATFADGSDKATVTVLSEATSTRTYEWTTNISLRDGLPTGSAESYAEQTGQPIVRTGNYIFDALYALAIEEARRNSVDNITDNAFNSGSAVACTCFETGEKWKYVWTRDTAYAVDLGLAVFDPTRAKNSLLFKLSDLKASAGGGSPQIVQDTGTGGSYPISTDRVIWALGAYELLKFLTGTERTTFRDTAYTALVNTVEHDRKVVYDSVDGLYTGEQSFLDWREQSYPSYTATDTRHIGMSRALSTNVAHYVILDVTSKLAAEKGLTGPQATYEGYRDTLATAINTKFWLSSENLYSTLKPTYLDQGALKKYDLLGESLAILTGIADAAKRTSILATYPHLSKGAPVIWPQQPLTPIYHNRGIWPFVTAYWLKAAAKGQNATAVDRAIFSLMRGAALNLSNMENFEMVTGNNYHFDGTYSGPVLNSRRQLWSVAGYMAMVQAVVFGMEADQTGIRFLPFITHKLRNETFASVNQITLQNIPYRGKIINVTVQLPATSGSTSGYYDVGTVTLNGSSVGTGIIAEGTLTATNDWVVALTTNAAAAGTIAEVTNTTDFKNLFAPREPNLTNVAINGANLEITFDANTETGTTFNIYRDGVSQATGQAGPTWVDTGSAAHATNTYCYTVEQVYTGYSLVSHRSAPLCFWGTTFQRIQKLNAYDFESSTGPTNWATANSKSYYQNWGNTSHTMQVAAVRPFWTGNYLLQLNYGNGSGPINTGITAAVKKIRIEEMPAASLVAEGVLQMPQRVTWSNWGDSDFFPVALDASKVYRITVLEDADARNMSYYQHFVQYTGNGGTGGGSGVYNRTNLTEVKLLPVSGTDNTPSTGNKVAFDGTDDIAQFNAAQVIDPGVTNQAWEKFALDWDADYLYVTIRSESFDDALRPFILYIDSTTTTFPAEAERNGITYTSLTPKIPFEATYAVGVRRTSDNSDGFGPWNGVWRWSGSAFTLQNRYESTEYWIAADNHTIAFKIPRIQIGIPTKIRISGHVVHNVVANEWKDTVPDTHMPWTTTVTPNFGYYEIDLAGATPATNWVKK